MKLFCVGVSFDPFPHPKRSRRTFEVRILLRSILASDSISQGRMPCGARSLAHSSQKFSYLGVSTCFPIPRRRQSFRGPTALRMILVLQSLPVRPVPQVIFRIRRLVPEADRAVAEALRRILDHVRPNPRNPALRPRPHRDPALRPRGPLGCR